MKEIFCKFNWHDWEKWQDTGEKYVQTYHKFGFESILLPGISRDGREQLRKCKACGKIQREMY